MKLPSINSRYGYPLALAIHKISRILQHEGLTGFGRRLQKKLSQPRLPRRSYQDWIDSYDTLNDQTRHQIRGHIQNLPLTPTVSVIVVVRAFPCPWLKRSIESLQRQLYPHWELCLVLLGIASDSDLMPWANEVNSDHRIRILHCPTVDEISNAKNTALDQSTGDFVTFMDSGDEVPEHALYYIIEAIGQNPDAGLVYSDEDQINLDGERLNPHFKCDFNYELFLADNLPSRLTLYSRALLKQLGGLRTEYSAAEEYDLALRAIEYLNPAQIVHISRILYHRRILPNASPPDLENLAIHQAYQAVQDHLHRCAVGATVWPAPESPSHRRVRFPLPMPTPLVSIIIPTKDRADLLSTCIHSLLTKSSYPNIEILIIDNGSVEAKTLALFDQLPKDRLRILRDDRPFNYSALNNRGVQSTQGELICLMNNDIEILTPDWLEEMVSFAHRPDIGCVGARLWYPSGLLQHGGVITGIGEIAAHAHANLPRKDPGYFHRALLHQSFSAVTAACLVVRRAVFNQVGGLDESLAVAFNDVDFCLRVQSAGYRNVWTPYAEMIHHESATRGLETTPAKQARFEQEIARMEQKWGAQLYQDPAYNPNLSIEGKIFSCAFPPRLPSLSQGIVPVQRETYRTINS